MATIATPNPLVLKDVILEIEDDDFNAHVISVTFTPSASTILINTLSPDGVFTDVGPATWTCNLDFVQDWTQTDSLSRYLFDHEGQTIPVTFKPKRGEGPSFAASIVVTPGAIGGTIGQFAQSSVALGVVGRPTLVPAA